MTDTQNSAGVRPTFYEKIDVLHARIAELETHIAAEPDRMREVVERCAVIARTHAMRRFATAGFIRDEIAAAIRAQEIKP